MVLVSPPVLFYQTLCNIQTVASKWLEGMVAQKPSFSLAYYLELSRILKYNSCAALKIATPVSNIIL